MVRLTFKWNFALFSCLCLINATNSLPITNVLHKSDVNVEITDLKSEENFNVALTRKPSDESKNVQRSTSSAITRDENSKTDIIAGRAQGQEKRIIERSSQVRPGQEVAKYALTFTRNGNVIRGRAVLTIDITEGTTEDPIRLHCDGLTIESVRVGIFSDVNAEAADFGIDNGVLEIRPNQQGTVYVVIIEYNMPLRKDGTGIFIADFNNVNYLAMNLHPTNARRVFPCVDEPNDVRTVVFTFNDLEYSNIVSNSQLEDNSETQFKPLQGPVHTWGMVAHNLLNVNVPAANALLYVRPGIVNQDAQASAAITFLLPNLNEWTGKSYFEMILNQDGRMHVFSLPDSNRDWYALSTVCIWEPYMLMETTHSVRQRTIALTTIAEAMSRQWFGYAIYPENFRFQWIITGLAKYSAYELLKVFQHDPNGNDVNLLDMNAIFTTEVIQESLLRDAYSNSQPMQPREHIFDENQIRFTVNGLIKYKAPAFLRMLRLILGDEDQDFIQSGARALFNWEHLTWINARNFYDAINSEWLFEGNEIIDNIADFTQPWVETTGYPLVHVGLRQGGLLLTQEHFSFDPAPRGNFLVPITYTTESAPNFDNLHPVMMLEVTTTLTIALGLEEFVLFNLQGQGYYRVNYDIDLWGRIIGALYDPERREIIHPLNRATLIDDSLNLARAGKINYDIAFEVVLAMELETEYPAWKAFVRNMDFLRKHLLLYVEDEDLDRDIYLRMIRRTIGTFEEEIGFEPDPNANVPAMVSLTRGLVMDHACRANYDPCIAAAIDWFYDPNNNEAVNPNIPHEIRPAVYCTMVREGDEGVIEALEAHLEEQATHYERLVILEAMACSEDGDFIQDLLLRTIADDSPYGVEERVKIFTAVAQSNFDNTNAAITFLSRNTQEVRDRYGGPDRLEELLFVLADNIVGPFQLEQFLNWINSVNSNLWDSVDLAMRARDQAIQTMAWRDAHIEDIYNWIDENDASTMIVSSFLILLSLCIAMFNN